MKRHSGRDCQDLPARFGRSSVLSQWCLFMIPKVNFTIHTHITTDDPEQIPVIDSNISRDNLEPRHKIQMIQRADELPSDPDDQLLPNVRDSVWIETQMIQVIHSWKKEDFRRVPRWKISHGGECKAENGLRHSALSVSEWLVNSLMWQTKFQYSTHQDGGGRSKNGLIKIDLPWWFFH